jgi:hypothetical protein
MLGPQRDPPPSPATEQLAGLAGQRASIHLGLRSVTSPGNGLNGIPVHIDGSSVPLAVSLVAVGQDPSGGPAGLVGPDPSQPIPPTILDLQGSIGAPMHIDETGPSSSGAPMPPSDHDLVGASANLSRAGLSGSHTPAPPGEQEDVDVAMLTNKPNLPGAGLFASMGGSGSPPASTVEQEHVGPLAGSGHSDPSTPFPPANIVGQEPDNPMSGSVDPLPGHEQSPPPASTLPPPDPTISPVTGPAGASAASGSDIVSHVLMLPHTHAHPWRTKIAAVKAIIAPIFPRLTGLESSVHTLVDRRDLTPAAVSSTEFVPFQINTPARQAHVGANRSSSSSSGHHSSLTPSRSSPRKRAPVIRLTSDSVGVDINLYNVRMSFCRLTPSLT